MQEFQCLDCGKLLEQITPGIVVDAWLRTDGNKDIISSLPGIYGKELGFVCNNCNNQGDKLVVVGGEK